MIDGINQKVVHVIITSQEASCSLALNELRRVDPAARLIRKLADDTQLVNIPQGYTQLLQNMDRSGFVFLRHMFPVTERISPEDNDTIRRAQQLMDSSDSIGDCINRRVEQYIQQLDPQQATSIQLRKSDRYNNKPLANAIAEGLVKKISDIGFNYNVQQPEQVITLYFDHESEVYLGISRSRDNLSNWNAGMFRFRKEDTQISRAEFKLLEALHTFEIQFPSSYKRAIDLGAAPGGWTKLLLDYGLHVTAIDPAQLSDKLQQDSRVLHYRDVAQNFKGKSSSYHIIVNDMRMDAIQSAHIMNNMQPYLTTDGMAIVTLKLPKQDSYKKMKQALHLLERKYQIKRVKQLFHNRSELSVYMLKLNQA